MANRNEVLLLLLALEEDERKRYSEELSENISQEVQTPLNSNTSESNDNGEHNSDLPTVTEQVSLPESQTFELDRQPPESHSENGVRRSGRARRPPAYLQDYSLNQSGGE
ncbi:hypothetical protein ACJJTC_014568 [Scirpophaga incertulas]